MTPGEYDITVQKNATFSLTMDATDDLGVVNFGATYDAAELSVWPAWAVQKGTSGLPLLQMTDVNNRITIAADSLILQLTSVETAALDFREGVYELRLINNSTSPATVDKLLAGKFFVAGL